MITLRNAVPSDAATLTRIVRSSSAYAGRYRAQAERVDFSAEYILENYVRVAEDEEQNTVGFCSVLRPGLFAGVHDAELDFLFVDDRWQKLGIGRILVADVVAAAGAMNIERIAIVAHPPSRLFYEKLGAEYVGEREPVGNVTWPRSIYLLKVSHGKAAL